MTRNAIWAAVVAGTCLLAGCGSAAPSGTEEPTPALPTAPNSERVDLDVPRFSDPTSVTNPLFAITSNTQVVQLGREGDTVLRHEITLLPEIKTVEWDGQRIDTVVSQFVAYGDGEVLEVARDFFAQADDGSVWYFGEDVANYADGTLDNTDGTWLAGRDGPPGMIMPADPRVGDVYRPENVPGLVFEEVTVRSVTETVAGPQGQITGALLVQELLMDGVLEDKIFAPGYGEFRADVPTEDEHVAVAVGVPADAATGEFPAELDTITAGASDITVDPAAAAVTLTRIGPAWAAYRTADVPPLLVEQMDQALASLRSAIDDQDVGGVRRAALELSLAGLDLRMRHESLNDVDLGRMDVHTQRLVLDAQEGAAAAAAGDVVLLQAITDRLTLAEPVQTDLQNSLDGLRAAVDTDDLDAVAEIAADLGSILEPLR